MVAVSEMSAFEMYQNQKLTKNRDKKERKIAKKKKLKLNPLATAELLKIASDHSKKETKKKLESIKQSAEEPTVKLIEGMYYELSQVLFLLLLRQLR